jgi:hypothetical protein
MDYTTGSLELLTGPAGFYRQGYHCWNFLAGYSGRAVSDYFYTKGGQEVDILGRSGPWTFGIQQDLAESDATAFCRSDLAKQLYGTDSCMEASGGWEVVHASYSTASMFPAGSVNLLTNQACVPSCKQTGCCLCLEVKESYNPSHSTKCRNNPQLGPLWKYRPGTASCRWNEELKNCICTIDCQYKDYPDRSIETKNNEC